MCQAGPRWRPNREIAWHTERLPRGVRYTNSKRSPSSNGFLNICPALEFFVSLVMKVLARVAGRERDTVVS